MKLTPRCRGALAVVARSKDGPWLRSQEVHEKLQMRRNRIGPGCRESGIFAGLSEGRTQGALNVLTRLQYVEQEARREEGKIVRYYRITQNGRRRSTQKRIAGSSGFKSIVQLVANPGLST